MKEMMFNWVEEHKGEREDGTWFVMGLDYLGELPFPTEEAIDRFLWDYAVDNPDSWMPDVP